MRVNEEIHYFYTLLLKRKWFFIVPFTIITVVGLGVAIVLNPIYESQATLLIQSQKIPQNLVQSTVASLADERIEVIGKKVMTRENLLSISNKFSLFTDGITRPSLTEIVAKMRKSTIIKRAPLTFSANRRSRRNAPTTIAFTVAFQHKNPQMAAKVANELVTVILNLDVTTRRLRASETTSFLQREAKRLEKQLVTIENQIIDFKRQNKDALPESLDYRLKRLESAQSELRVLDNQIVTYSSGISSTNTNKLANTNPTAQLAFLEAEYARQSAIYSSKHPALKALKRQISTIKKSVINAAEQSEPSNTEQKSGRSIITSSIGTKPVGYDSAPAGLRAQRDVVAANVEKLRKLIDQTPEVERGINLLARDYENTKQRYEDLVRKQQQARLGERLEEDKQSENVEVIEQPIVPQEPVRPNRLLILGLSFLAAFAAGGGAVTGLELLDRTIRTSSHLHQYTGVRPLITIPYIELPEENLKKQISLKIFIAVGIALVLTLLIIFHFFHTPIDLLFYRLFNLI